MSTIIIPLLPRLSLKEIKAARLPRFVNAAWQLAHCALWAEQEFSSQEIEATKDYIYEYFAAATDLKRAFIAFVHRIILTQKYVRKSPERFLPLPSVWFNRRYPFGFAGTLSWYHSVECQRKEVPGYLSHMEAFATGYYCYANKPTQKQLKKCREKLLEHQAHSLLQLFYSTVIHSNYIRA